MGNIENVNYKLYPSNIDIEKILSWKLLDVGFPIEIVAKAGMKKLTEWEIDRSPSDELLKKNNIDIEKSTIRSALPVIIEENFKLYESYYSEEEKKYLRYFLSKYCEVSDDKLNEIFGCNDIITEMKNTMQPIQAAKFNLLRMKKDDNTFSIDKCRDITEKQIIVFDKLINEMYSSSIINGRVGELDIWQETDQYGKKFCSIDNLSGFNKEDLSKYTYFIYSPEIEEFKGRDFFIFIICDIIPGFIDNFLYFAPIEYPNYSNLTVYQIIENYIYSTFYTVSEPIQRRFITFLQRYCSEKENKYVKTKSYK